jgi:hypothetical protein
LRCDGSAGMVGGRSPRGPILDREQNSLSGRRRQHPEGPIYKSTRLPAGKSRQFYDS